MTLFHLVAPGFQPIADAVSFDPFDGSGRTSGCTRRRPAAQIALAGLRCIRQREHRPEWTSNRAEMAAHAYVAQYHLRLRDRIDSNSVDRTRRHAPSFLTLKTRERRVTGFLV